MDGQGGGRLGCRAVRIFVAGASGVIGVRLVPLLAAGGHTVAGMTRSPGKTGLLRELGAQPVVCDVFDLEALTRVLAAFRPEVVLHQLTDLPDDAGDISRTGERNDRMRTEGTRNLLTAAAAAGADRFIAQSISWELPSPGRPDHRCRRPGGAGGMRRWRREGPGRRPCVFGAEARGLG
jgi:nucleoside-diphosphate-sugar epimerase